MSKTYAKRVPKSEQLRLINECRKSGLTDADWCRQNNISASTFYNWISRCRKDACAVVPEPKYGHSGLPQPKQDVVSIDIVPDTLPEQPPAVPVRQADVYLDNSHTIEVTMNSLTIRISNSADPVLLSRTLKLLREPAC